MALKTQKNKIWYSQCDAVAVVIGDWILLTGDDIPHDGNDPIDCIQIPDMSWSPQEERLYWDIDGTTVPREQAIRRIAEAIGGTGREHHAYLVAGLQPDAYIIDPRVLSRVW